MSSQFTSLLGWYLLPGFVTGYVQTALYTIFIRAGDPKPAPGSPRFISDRRKIQIGVILIYLVYTIVEADYQLRQNGDFFANLGVPLSVNDKGLQSRFRRLTVQYHPDKVAPAERSRVEAVFVHLKLAKDTLIDPTKRFAYERFGPDILQWQSCRNIKDYVLTGVRNTAGYYLGTAVVLLVTGMLGYLQSGKFWRYLVLAMMFSVELTIMTRPTYPAVLSTIVNPILETTGVRQPLLPFQLLTLLRKFALTIFIAISQLEPLLRNPANGSATSDSITPQQLDRIDALALATDQELSRLHAFELAQYGANAAAEQTLRSNLKEWLVQNTVRNDNEVRNAINQAFERRRASVAASGT